MMNLDKSKKTTQTILVSNDINDMVELKISLEFILKVTFYLFYYDFYCIRSFII